MTHLLAAPVREGYNEIGNTSRIKVEMIGLLSVGEASQ